MFTICPKCALTLLVTAEDLRVAQGYVRCGRCSSVFNALARLTEERQTLERFRETLPPAPPPPMPRQAPLEASRTQASPPASSAPDVSDEDSIPEDALEFDPGRADASSVFVEPPPSPQWSAAAGTFKAMMAANREGPQAEETHRAQEPPRRKEPERPKERRRAEERHASAKAEAPSPPPPRASSAAEDDVDIDVEIGPEQLGAILHIEEVTGTPAPPSPAAAAPAPEPAPPPRAPPATLRPRRLKPSESSAARDSGSAVPAAAGSPRPRPQRGPPPPPPAPPPAVTAEEVTAEDSAARYARALRLAPPAEGDWLQSLAWGALAGIALIVLLAQIVNHDRDELAANARFNRPLTALYAALGLELVPHWDVKAYDVRQLGAAVEPGGSGLITVRASVKNAAAQPQPLPLLRVTLQDRFGNRIAARDVAPRSYLPRNAPAFLSAGERIDAEMGFVDPGANAVGFEIDACLPVSDGAVTCANDGATR